MFTCKRAAVSALLGAAISLSAVSTQAATFTYDLADHEDGGRKAYDYGLRLDQTDPDRFFSFSAGSAKLVYDDVALTASISGTTRESLSGAGAFGGVFDISYIITGIEDLGSGAFRALGGSGLIDGIALGAEAKMGGTDDGYSFIFRHDGHRDAGSATSTIGRGWVSKVGGANDFLFRASLTPVPLPAAGWMLLAGLAGIGGLKRMRRGA